MKSFTLIAATDSHGGLGKENKLPWSSSKDMAWFKHQTTTVEDTSKKNACIMGRKTWESLPEAYRPLPDRLNLVLSRDSQSTDFEGAECFSSLDAALDRCQSDDIDSVFVIGGATLYQEAIQHDACRRLLLSRVWGSYNCDCFFPDFSREVFKPVRMSNVYVSGSQPNVTFYDYQRAKV